MKNAKCRLCHRGMFEIGGYLERVNEKGGDGIWECRPNCGADIPQETNLLLAIEGDPEPDAARLTTPTLKG